MDDRSFTIITVAILILSPILLYMNGNDDETVNNYDTSSGLVPVWERVNQNFNTTGSYSYTLESGDFDIMGPESVFIDVDLPSSELGCTITDDCQVHLGLWLPDVPNGTKIPVIADVGPYYDDGDVDALTPANRLGKFLIENMVPHGYAVAQVSVFGTGMSNHCMDFMGLSEQMGIDAAVTWLGTQEWSNGNVGIVGKSYDGTTPWQAAMFGNPHLKTIIPISGLIGVHDLMWRNGSMEARGLAMHNGVYGSFGWDGDSEDWQTMCRGYAEGYANGPAAYLAGDEVNYAGNTYWTDRHFLERTIQNYNGSIYFIHGMQDWNVDPHMAFPAYKQLQQAGFEIKGLFGQWGHHYPDRPSDQDSMPSGRGAEGFPYSVRYDWAQDLLEWFNYYLYDGTLKPYLHVEMQDNLGGWRVEETWPSADTEFLQLPIGEGLTVTSGSGLVGPTNTLTLETEIFENETRISGMPTFHVDVTIPPGQTSGHLFIELFIADGIHLGHGVMDLRYHAGGRECGQPCTVTGTVNAKMEMFAMDVVVPAGSALELVISQTGDDYIPSTVSSGYVTIGTNQNSVLSLPIIDRTADDLFVPPVWYENICLLYTSDAADEE